MNDQLKPLHWIGSSLKDLKALSDSLRDVFGYALHLAQEGKKHPQSSDFGGTKFPHGSGPAWDVDARGGIWSASKAQARLIFKGLSRSCCKRAKCCFLRPKEGKVV